MKVFNKKRTAINFIFSVSFMLLWIVLNVIFFTHGHAMSVTEGAKRVILKNGPTVILK